MGLFSIFSGRSEHSGTQADTSDEEDVPLGQQLLEARAEVARLEAMPLSAFAEKSHKALRPGFNGQLTTYSVDNKDDAVARAKARVAELKILTQGNDLLNKDPETK